MTTNMKWSLSVAIVAAAMIGLSMICHGQSDYYYPLGTNITVSGSSVSPLDTNAFQGGTVFRSAVLIGSGQVNIIESNPAASFIQTNAAGTVWNYLVGGTQSGAGTAITGATTNQYAYVTNTYNLATYWTNAAVSGGQYPTNYFASQVNTFPLQAGGPAYLSSHQYGGLYLGALWYQPVSGASGTLSFSKGIPRAY